MAVDSTKDRETLIKSTIRRRTYRAIYRLLDRVSPVDYDCGTLCQAACCVIPNEEDAEMGIYLLPGEDKIHDRQSEGFRWTEESTEDFEFPESWSGKVFFLHCLKSPHCQRSMRPIQCRTFPILPHITEDAELIMIYDDTDVPYRCPLIEDELPLNDDFVKATHTVWKHLIRDPLIYDLVKEDSEARY